MGEIMYCADCNYPQPGNHAPDCQATPLVLPEPPRTSRIDLIIALFGLAFALGMVALWLGR